jgi:hypothetical protein
MTPLRRSKRSERPVNPERVVPGTATSRLNSYSAAETPGGATRPGMAGEGALARTL